MFILHSVNNAIDEERLIPSDDMRKKSSTMKTPTSLQEDGSLPSSSYGVLHPNRPRHPDSSNACVYLLSSIRYLYHCSLSLPGSELCLIVGDMFITAGSSSFLPYLPNR